MIPITRSELRAFLLARTASSMVSLITVTDPDMYVGAKGVRGGPKCPKADAIKINKLGVNIAGRYDKTVENALEREIKAERELAQQPPLSADEMAREVMARFRKGESWHRPIFDGDEPTCLSVNKKIQQGAEADAPAYLRMVVQHRGDAVFLDPKDGTEIPKSELSDWLKPPSEYKNQGLEKPKVFLCPGLDSIVEIAIDGDRYRITDNFQQYPLPSREVLWNIAEEYLSGERKMTKV